MTDTARPRLVRRGHQPRAEEATGGETLGDVRGVPSRRKRMRARGGTMISLIVLILVPVAFGRSRRRT